ncbi:MAG: hypothetical protein RL291_473 [Pseudomonadota bacterium]
MTHPLRALPDGSRLDGRYVIRATLAAGSFGVTYLAEHATLGTLHAIKESFPQQLARRDVEGPQIIATDPSMFAWSKTRFLDEARKLATCKHPNVVAVSDVFEANGSAYMVLEFVQGQTLLAWRQSLGRAPTRQVRGHGSLGAYESLPSL